MAWLRPPLSGYCAKRSLHWSNPADGPLLATPLHTAALILKSTDIPNFAQGEMALVSAYVAFFLMSRYRANFWLALLAAPVFAMLLALIVEQITIRPILGAGALSAVFMTFGLNISLNSFTALCFGPAQERMPTPWPSTPLHLGDVVVSWTSLAALVVGFAGMLALRAFFRYHRSGCRCGPWARA